MNALPVTVPALGTYVLCHDCGTQYSWSTDLQRCLRCDGHDLTRLPCPLPPQVLLAALSPREARG